MFNHSPFKFMILITTCLSIAGCMGNNPTQPNTKQNNQSSKMIRCHKDFYDTQGNLITKNLYDENGKLVQCTKDLYDAHGNLAVRNLYDDQGKLIRENFYDGLGKPINNRTPDNAGPIRPPVGGGAGGGDGGMCVLM